MKPIVCMMLGLPGSGKTTFSKRLQTELELERFSVDEEYSRLGGDLHNANWDKDIAVAAGGKIKQLTALRVGNGQSVILDLCPWVKANRDKYRHFIHSIGAECQIYYFDVDKEELLRRLSLRNQLGEDFYIVSVQMLDEFIEEFDPPMNEDVIIIKQSD